MKRRRVSAAFIELDTAEVIRAKDEEAAISETRVLTVSQNQNRRSPRIAGATSDVDLRSMGSTMKEAPNMSDSGQLDGFNNLQTGNSSHLADIAPKPRDTEHAMSTRSHRSGTRSRASLGTSEPTDQISQQEKTKESSSNSSTNVNLTCSRRMATTHPVSMSHKAQESPQQNNHVKVKSAISIVNNVPSSPTDSSKQSKSGRASMQERLQPSRPRTSRKTRTLETKTNGSLSEDSCPTADDYSLRGTMKEGIPLVPADSEVLHPPKRKYKRRQRISTSQTTTGVHGARRKSARIEKIAVNLSSHKINQLPLTSSRTGGSRTELPDQDTGAGLPPVESSSVDMIHILPIPETTLPRAGAEELQPRPIKTATNQRILIDLSSSSSSNYNKVITDADAETSENDRQPLPRHGRGRGRTVGEKLADALMGSKRNYQTLEIGSFSTQNSGKISASRRSPSTANTEAPSCRVTRSRLLLGSKVERKLLKSTPLNGNRRPVEIEPSWPVLDTGMLAKTTQIPENTADLKTHQLSQTRESPSNMELVGHETGRDGAIEHNDMPDDHRQIPGLSEFAVKPGTSSSLASDRKETEHDSHLSPTSKPTNIVGLLHPGDRNEQTPDSQRPLLSAQSRRSVPGNTSLHSVQHTTRRCCTVDHNGSPRLPHRLSTSADQLHSHLEMSQIRSLVGMSDSSSIYSNSSGDEKSLEEYSLEHQPVARPIWTRFQREMFKEYGNKAEELMKQKTRPFLFSRPAEGLVSAKALEETQQLETGPFGLSPRMNKDNLDETMTHSGMQENSLHGTRGGSHGTITCSDRESDQRIDQARDLSNLKPNLTPIPSTAQSDPESMEWISTLMTAQHTAHDQLLETNQHLSTQLAAEQESIREVLQLYRQGCNRMLQELFRAQEWRMDLYQKQMASVKEQHTEICQDLIRELQELDSRVQQGSKGRGVVPHIP